MTESLKPSPHDQENKGLAQPGNFDPAAGDRTSLGSEKTSYELMVCGFENRPAHCVYVNEYRIVGGKPWGGGRTTAKWTFTLDDLRRAFPALEINEKPHT